MVAKNNTPPVDDFDTERLSILHWSSSLEDSNKKLQLAETLVQILSPVVLEHLPPSVQVEQTTEAVLTWIDDRSEGSDVHLVINEQSQTLIGLLVLVSEPQNEAHTKIHIGYLLSSKAWGNGYASELVAGLLQQAASQAPMTLIGGVAKGNEASAHILQKHGFSIDPNLSDDETEVFKIVLAQD